MSSGKEEGVDEAAVLENIAKWQAVQGALTPLTDKQHDIIYKIQDKITDIYYYRMSNTSSKRPASEIDSIRNYAEWYTKIENAIKREHLRTYTNYGDQLNHNDNLCNEICDNTGQVIGSLKDLQGEYKNVSTKTNSLHTGSDQLMKDGKILKEKKNVIADKLSHFWAFGQLQQQLQLYANDVNSDHFVHMLRLMEVSLEFFCRNKQLKDGASYRYRFESLLTQACHHVIRQFSGILSEVTAQAQGADSTAPVSVDNAASFYYGNFQNAAAKLTNVLNHLERMTENRANSNDIYTRAINECHRTYFSLRTPMITTAVKKALFELNEKHKTDQTLLFRSSGFFVMKVCEDEAACFQYFFTTPTEQLCDYLSVMCEILYDALRPCLIQIDHLEVLTELCTSLKEMLNNQVRQNVALDRFSLITSQLLHDVEERLVFRANIFFQNDIRSYNPSPGDLAYPEKLEDMENMIENLASEILEAMISDDKGTKPQRSFTGNSVADFHGMWYPSVKRTLVCLSRLYLCLDREVFQGLAQEALLVCVESLDKAGALVAVRRPKDGLLHGHLFQVKHLLILREQIAPFQVEFTVRETGLDWAGFLNRGDRMFTHGGRNALLEFLLEGTVPQVREYLIDSRKEIDLQLKRTCEGFISAATTCVLSPIYLWLEQAEVALLAMIGNVSAHTLFKQGANGQPRSLAALVTATQRNIKVQIPVIQKMMKTYLSNKETEFILFRPIKNNILLAFLRLDQLMKRAKYTVQERTLVACPSAEVLNVLISSVSLNADHNTAPTGPSRVRTSSQSSHASTSTKKK